MQKYHYGLKNLRQMCVAQQTDVKNNKTFEEWTCFLTEWINTTASAGRDSYCMYSHTSAFNHLSSPLWLIYLFSSLFNKNKSGLKMKLGGEVLYLGLLWCRRYTPFLPEIWKLYTFLLFLFIFQVGVVTFHTALPCFSSHFHFIMQF